MHTSIQRNSKTVKTSQIRSIYSGFKATGTYAFTLSNHKSYMVVIQTSSSSTNSVSIISRYNNYVTVVKIAERDDIVITLNGYESFSVKLSYGSTVSIIEF